MCLSFFSNLNEDEFRLEKKYYKCSIYSAVKKVTGADPVLRIVTAKYAKFPKFTKEVYFKK